MSGTRDDHSRYDAFAKALPDEPLFTLLARDPDADKAWLAWIIARLERIRDGKKPWQDLAQVKDAIAGLVEARAWREICAGGGSGPGLPLPGPADAAYINQMIGLLLGRAPVMRDSQAERNADDQGIRR